MTDDQFNTAKHVLADKVKTLMLSGKKLLEDKINADKATGFSGFKQRRATGRRLGEFEVNCMLAEKEFTKLDQVA